MEDNFNTSALESIIENYGENQSDVAYAYAYLLNLYLKDVIANGPHILKAQEKMERGMEFFQDVFDHFMSR